MNSLRYVRKIMKRGIKRDPFKTRLTIDIDVYHRTGIVNINGAPMNRKVNGHSVACLHGAMRFAMQMIEDHFNRAERPTR